MQIDRLGRILEKRAPGTTGASISDGACARRIASLNSAANSFGWNVPACIVFSAESLSSCSLLSDSPRA